LIERGCPVDSKDIIGCTPLHLASFKGMTKIVELLIENGASVDDTDNNGNTALHYAVGEKGKAFFDSLLNLRISWWKEIYSQSSNPAWR
jgi:ankyrin repeat protein